VKGTQIIEFALILPVIFYINRDFSNKFSWSENNILFIDFIAIFILHATFSQQRITLDNSLAIIFRIKY
jgi:hypothetical protein